MSFIVAAKRTPFGGFGGKLSHLSATELASISASATLSQLPKEITIDSCIYGNVLQTSSGIVYILLISTDAAYLARHVALRANLPISTPAITINRLCGSGMQAIVQAALEINSNESKISLVGGTENMSQAPYAVRNIRSGTKYGADVPMEDTLAHGLVDSYPKKTPMGITAENLGKKYNISRAQVDEYALLSQQRYAKALANGRFTNEICPIELKTRKGVEIMKEDEHPRAQTTIESLAKLKPVFIKDVGLVTAGNASGICDGAASLVVAGAESVKKYNISPMARIVSWASVGCEPSLMGIGPVPAIQLALKRANLTMKDISLFEINEAFAAQYLAVEKELGLDRAITNVNGGAIAIGHPLGASGARVVIHLINELQRTKAKYGVASLLYSAVVGIDYGTDWFKVSLIKPGPQIETVLNRESKRKTAAVVLMRDGIRYYGSDAVSLGTRFPQDTYATLKNVIGKPFNHSSSIEYRNTFTNTMVEDSKRGVVAFQDGKITWTVEALIAMQLAHAKQQAELYGGQIASAAVITVPPYFGQFERRIIMDAAEIADIKVLELMNDETAVALSFAIGKKDSDFDIPQYHIFYDMGAGSTVASLVKFSNVNVTTGINKVALDIEVISMGYDMSLGGRSFDVRISTLLVKKFIDGPGSKYTDVSTNVKAMAKFLKEANRVKHILSANQDVFASIENVIDGVDFKVKITRKELESISLDLFKRVSGPVESVLRNAQLSLKDVSSLVLVGGGVRIPEIQKVLTKLVGTEKIARNVDGDEAAVFGAVYQAATISAQFRVRRQIRIKDITDKAINLRYESEGILFYPAQFLEAGRAPIDVTLFNSNSLLGSKKLMSFMRSSDFTFKLVFGKSNIPIATVSVTGLNASKETFKEKIVKSLKVKALLELDDSGLLNVGSVYALFEVEPETKGSTIKDTIGNVMNFFGKKEKTDGEPNDDPEASEVESGKKESEKRTTSDKDIKVNSTAAEKKALLTKVSLNYTIEWETVIPLTVEQKNEIKKTLIKMDFEDKARRVREEARNVLESYIYSSKEILYDDKIEKVTTQSQRDKLKEVADESSEWLEDNAETADTFEFKKKYEYLVSLRAPMEIRRDEAALRPGAYEIVNKSLLLSNNFLTDAKANFTKLAIQKNNTNPEADSADDEILPEYTSSSIDLVEKLITSAEKFYKEVKEKQDKTEAHEEPVFLVKELMMKIEIMEDSIKRLIISSVPKRKKTKKSSAKSTKTTTTEKSKETIKSNDDTDEEVKEEEKGNDGREEL